MWVLTFKSITSKQRRKMIKHNNIIMGDQTKQYLHNTYYYNYIVVVYKSR